MPLKLFGALLSGILLLPSAVQADPPERSAHTTLLVFAAASLTDALEEGDQAFSARHPATTVKASYAASSVLAKQIEAGAPAGVFVSADREWMDYLDQRGRLRAGTRRDLLGNTLVLIAP